MLDDKSIGRHGAVRSQLDAAQMVHPVICDKSLAHGDDTDFETLYAIPHTSADAPTGGTGESRRRFLAPAPHIPLRMKNSPYTGACRSRTCVFLRKLAGLSNGRGGIRTPEDVSQQIYSLPRLATPALARIDSAAYLIGMTREGNIRREPR